MSGRILRGSGRDSSDRRVSAVVVLGLTFDRGVFFRAFRAFGGCVSVLRVVDLWFPNAIVRLFVRSLSSLSVSRSLRGAAESRRWDFMFYLFSCSQWLLLVC